MSTISKSKSRSLESCVCENGNIWDCDATSSSNQSQSASNKTNNTTIGIAVGVAVGGAILLGLGVVGIVLLLRKRRARRGTR